MNNIVFIVAIDTEQRSNDQGYEWSIKSWKKWCDKNGHQLFILDKPIYDLKQCKANWHKLFVYDLLENEGIEYDKIAIVDSDTIVHPDCPNFFDMVGDTPLWEEQTNFVVENLYNDDLIPDEYQLSSPYPNPFNPVLTIDFSLITAKSRIYRPLHTFAKIFSTISSL